MERLTIEFHSDGLGQGQRQLSVGRLTGEGRAEVDSSEALQLEDVANALLGASGFGVTVHHPLLLPPGHLWRRIASHDDADEDERRVLVERSDDVVHFDALFVRYLHRLWWHCAIETIQPHHRPAAARISLIIKECNKVAIVVAAAAGPFSCHHHRQALGGSC